MGAKYNINFLPFHLAIIHRLADNQRCSLVRWIDASVAVDDYDFTYFYLDFSWIPINSNWRHFWPKHII